VQATFELRKLRSPANGSVVSVGVFDGVHLGHREILGRNTARAAELGAVPTVVTFQRHPKRTLLGRAPRTLTSLEHRMELFRRIGIEHCVALKFDEQLRALEAEEFARIVLREGLGARLLVLGFDSKFGKDRRGTPELMQRLGFEVEIVPQVVVSSRAVSSTAIREAVELGDLPAAAAMLGRPVTLLGIVVRGQQLGTRIGFPTANLELHSELHPPVGVYACQARRADEPESEPLAAVTNIGFRPTVNPAESPEPTVEAHLLDFSGDLYGRRLELEFVARLRGEVRFPNVDALRAQIDEDVAEARRILATV